MYKIIGKTNPWIAQHDSLFKGKTEITIQENLTMKEAMDLMITFYNEDHWTFYPNWGFIMHNDPYNAGVDEKGLYYYENDSRIYRIEKIENDTDTKN